MRVDQRLLYLAILLELGAHRLLLLTRCETKFIYLPPDLIIERFDHLSEDVVFVVKGYGDVGVTLG
jgi:hypothetical protein